MLDPRPCVTAPPGIDQKFTDDEALSICKAICYFGAKVIEADLLQILRKHDPEFCIVVGDPAQLPPFVAGSQQVDIQNPWVESLRMSTMQRALNVGGVVKTLLKLNHRGYGNLHKLPSKLVYRYAM
ncbi:hypothetical protein V8F20_004157 [Naviculisporaceae sp. PSN 640]